MHNVTSFGYSLWSTGESVSSIFGQMQDTFFLERQYIIYRLVQKVFPADKNLQMRRNIVNTHYNMSIRIYDKVITKFYLVHSDMFQLNIAIVSFPKKLAIPDPCWSLCVILFCGQCMSLDCIILQSSIFYCLLNTNILINLQSNIFTVRISKWGHAKLNVLCDNDHSFIWRNVVKLGDCWSRNFVVLC